MMSAPQATWPTVVSAGASWLKITPQFQKSQRSTCVAFHNANPLFQEVFFAKGNYNYTATTPDANHTQVLCGNFTVLSP